MSYREILPIWWSMTWRGLAAGLTLGLGAGMIVTFAVSALGFPVAGIRLGSVVWVLGGIIASIWALRAALLRHRVEPFQGGQ